MDRLFRYILRLGALALLAVGVGLVVYSMQAGNESSSTAPNIHDGRDGDSTATGTAPADTGLQGRMKIESFTHHIDKQSDRVIILSGPTAYRDQEKLVSTVVEPVITSYDIAQDGTRTRNARLTANGAVWHENEGVVELTGEVVAGGQDFQVETASVVFNVGERTLVTDSEVRITGYRTTDAEQRVPTMHTVGQGMQADLVLSRIELQKLITTTIYSAAADMFEEDSSGAGEEDRNGNLVITCHGPALYEHGASTVTYQNKVRANSGTKTLTCKNLVIQFEEAAPPATGTAPETEAADAAPGVTLSQVSARGDAELRATLQETNLLARGERLDWQNLAQIITLTGEPAHVDTDSFTAEGKEIRIVRMTAGYRVEGEGSLVWKATGEATAERLDEADGWEPVSLQLDNTQSTHVSWTEAMQYDTTTNSATFTGDVEVKQATTALTCDKLSLAFDRTEESRNPRPVEVIATGNVAVNTGERQATCQKLTWDAQTGRIAMKAAENRELALKQGPMTVHANTIHVDNANQRFSVPGPGRLAVADAPNAEEPRAPLTVSWQKEALLQRGAEQYALFKGSVKAVTGTRALQGDTVRVDLGPDQSPTTILVTGNAVIEVTGAVAEEAATLETAADAAAPDQRWRLSGERYTIDLADDSVSTDKAGVLTMLTGDTSAGTLTWQGAMNLDMSENSATFTRNVTARTSAGSASGQKITMQFGIDKETGHRTVQQIGLDGKVRFEGTGEDALDLTAKSALAIFDEDGKLSQFIAHDEVTLSAQNRRLTAGQLVLKFDHVEDEEGNKSLEVVNATAEKDVRIKYDNREIEAGADRVDWNRAVDSYTLTGDPAWIMRAGLRSQGKTLTYYGPTGATQ